MNSAHMTAVTVTLFLCKERGRFSAGFSMRRTAIFLPVVSIVLVLGVRGYCLSGVPFYPSTIAYLPTEWSVPLDKVRDEANWIYGWARQPGTHWSHVIGSWSWLEPWMERVSWRFIDVFFPVELFYRIDYMRLYGAVFEGEGCRSI